MGKLKILYAEDDETLAFLTKDSLEENGYEVIHCADGHNCTNTFEPGKFDICILDIMLPKKDGFEIATEIRRQDTDIPIIFLSAKTLKEDRLKGLRLGADDYLVKPFSMEELLLKIAIFLKRSAKTAKQVETGELVGGFTFDALNYRLSKDGTIITLTQRESELLSLFLRSKNKVMKREDILKSLWGDDDYFMGRSLDVFISRLRKILVSEEGIAIENLHGIGFRFVVR